MDEHNKLDKLTEEIRDLTLEVRVGFTRYNELLSHHIEGVEQNRENLTMLRKELTSVNKHVAQVRAIIAVSKWVGVPTILGSAIVLYIKYLLD